MPVNLYDGTETGFSAYHAFGLELECSGANVSRTTSRLSRDGVIGTRNEHEAGQVDCETVLAPLAAGPRAQEYIESVLTSIRAAGGDGATGCGMHVHVSNAHIVGVTGADSADAFTNRSIDHTERTGRVIFQDHPELLGDPMLAVECGDIAYRYTYQQDAINGMHPASRTNNGMCRAIRMSEITRAIASLTADQVRITELANATNGKFSTINLQPWTDQGTIEFRQAMGTVDLDKCIAWVAFVLNLVNWTTTQRFASTTTTETVATPERGRDCFAPQAHRLMHVYDMLRTDGGASCHEIMMDTGVAETSVRRMVSEIRNRVGDSAVTTYTQQVQGRSYGDGTDHTAWKVERTFDSIVAGILEMQTEVNPSIWSGLDEEHYGWWMDRIDHIARY
tara:strand:- start:462 stop:1640 length:1179 start_codon:yes stop_codon:yes gene_type:complete